MSPSEDAAPDEDRDERDENRRQNLEDVLGTPGGGEADEEHERGQPASDSQPATPASDSSTPTSSSEASPEGPAFAFGKAAKESIYPRQRTWLDYQVQRSELKRDLADAHEIDDIQGREIDDAVLRVARENPELVKQALLDARDA